MGFQGIKYSRIAKNPTKSLNGFYGVKITFDDVIPVKVTDYRGKGLSNVSVQAENPNSGVPFLGITDRTGSVFMNLDGITDITVTKNQIIKIVQYNGEISPTYTIDLPFIENN